MKLEQKKEQVVSFPRFVKRVIKYSMFALVLIAFSLLIGIIGYHYLGNLNFIYSFHMSSMILTGMGPVANMQTDAAKLFSSFYALYSGVAFLTVTAVFFAPIVHRLLHILHVQDDKE